MLESSYNLLFGKLALRCLFEDYFEEARHFRTRIMLRPIDDPHVDLIASVSYNLLNFYASVFASIHFIQNFKWKAAVDSLPWSFSWMKL